jgi:hypothetical protein
MEKIILIIISLLAYSYSAVAQEGEIHLPDESHERTATYEVIISGIYSFEPNSGHGKYGSELHFTYWFNHVWGAGFGYTVLFEEDHRPVQQFAFLGSFNPVGWLTINAGPNFTLPYDGSALLLSGYLETEFNYRPRSWVHFGPVLGAVIGNETEFNVGFHLGFEF